MMFLVFGALFEGVTRLPGLPDRQLLRVPRADGDPAHDRAGHRQRRRGARRRLPEPLRVQAADRADLDRLDRARPADRRQRAAVRPGGGGPAAGDRARRARRDRGPRRGADDRARHAAGHRHVRRADREPRAADQGCRRRAGDPADGLPADLPHLRLPAARADREPGDARDRRRRTRPSTCCARCAS